MNEEKKVLKNIEERVKLLKEVFPETNAKELLASTIASTMVEARESVEMRAVLKVTSKILKLLAEVLDQV